VFKVTATRPTAALPGIRVTFHVGLDGLQALRESWDSILSQSGHVRFFHEWSWYRAYLLHLEPAPQNVYFALLTCSGDPIAIVPLQSVWTSSHGVTSKLWRLPEHSHMPLGDVIAADHVSATEIVAALLEAMRAEAIPWDRVQFTGFGKESCLNRLDLAGGHPIYRDILTTCDQVVCNLPWEAFARRLSSNFRSNLNKARHKIEREGGAGYEITSDPGRITALFPEFLRVEASGWKGAAGTRTAICLDPRLSGFYRSLIAGFGASRRVFINAMRFADRVIATQFCLCDSDTLYILKQGYDEAFAHLAPGNSLLEQLVRWSFTNTSLRKVNLAGSPRWFQDWKPERSNVYRLHFFNSTPLGQIHRIKYAARMRLRPWIIRRGQNVG
jgi:CelD/BcsL family acetyltransferase involved in cellulose biosynthesis